MLGTLTIVYAILLGLLGVVGYVASGRKSPTALIPLYFGIVTLIVWFITARLMDHATLVRGMVIVALIGFIATVSGIPEVLRIMGGKTVERPGAAIGKSIMAVLSLAYGIIIVLL